jgi:hypothetical protein
MICLGLLNCIIQHVGLTKAIVSPVELAGLKSGRSQTMTEVVGHVAAAADSPREPVSINSRWAAITGHVTGLPPTGGFAHETARSGTRVAGVMSACNHSDLARLSVPPAIGFPALPWMNLYLMTRAATTA